jgi:hypothetical protein
VDNNAFSKTALAQYIKVGAVYLGDINGGASGSIPTTGVLTSCIKYNNYWGPNDSLIACSFNSFTIGGANPIVFLNWYDTTPNSVCNDI